MKSKNHKILFPLFIIIIAVVVFIPKEESQQVDLTYQVTEEQVPPVEIRFPNSHSIQVEVVESSEDRQRGLSHREYLAEGHGMLFLSDRRPQSFWMKDMNFDIDIIWIDNNVIIGFETNISHEKIPLESYLSPVPVDKVLEVNAGFVNKNSLEIGDMLDIMLP